MRYEDLSFKIPKESPTYCEDSAFVIQQINAILDARKAANDNKIIINTNLKLGLPLEIDRNGIGIEINPEYIKMIKERLAEEFSGFDSIDERMKRVPNDLNDPIIREEYIRNHVEWFLKNHPDAVEEFMQEVRQKYEAKMLESGQMSLFEIFGTRFATATV